MSYKVAKKHGRMTGGNCYKENWIF